MTKYEDMLHLPRPASAHAPMSVSDRAAQFSPFAALTGHDAAMNETARQTLERIEITDEVRQDISAKLACLLRSAGEAPPVRITWYQPDARKAGGSYVTSVGVVRKLDELTNVLTLASGEKIAVVDVVAVELSPSL